jgi:hypothetical protein
LDHLKKVSKEEKIKLKYQKNKVNGCEPFWDKKLFADDNQNCIQQAHKKINYNG